MEKKDWLAWFEIPVSDLARAQKFYETIFETQLQFADLGILKMSIFPHNFSGGALVLHPDWYFPSERGVLIYMNANPDLNHVLEKIPAAGGAIVIPKKQISPEHGFMAVFNDTEGNRVALHSMD